MRSFIPCLRVCCQGFLGSSFEVLARNQHQRTTSWHFRQLWAIRNSVRSPEAGPLPGLHQLSMCTSMFRASEGHAQHRKLTSSSTPQAGRRWQEDKSIQNAAYAQSCNTATCHDNLSGNRRCWWRRGRCRCWLLMHLSPSNSIACILGLSQLQLCCASLASRMQVPHLGASW